MIARSTATHNPINRVLGRLSGVEKSGVSWKARCPLPGHGQKRGDRNPSLHGSEGDDGRVLLKCRVGCSTDAMLDAAGLIWGDLFPRSVRSEPTAVWRIKDAQGTEQATHVRFDRPTDKRLLWKLPGASGWGLKGRVRDTLPLYGSERVKYYPEDVPITFTEGEKATDALLAPSPEHPARPVMKPHQP